MAPKSDQAASGDGKTWPHDTVRSLLAAIALNSSTQPYNFKNMALCSKTGATESSFEHQFRSIRKEAKQLADDIKTKIETGEISSSQTTPKRGAAKTGTKRKAADTGNDESMPSPSVKKPRVKAKGQTEIKAAVAGEDYHYAGEDMGEYEDDIKEKIEDYDFFV